MKLFCVADQLIESGDAEKAAQLTIIAPVRAILRMSDSPLNEITGRLVVVGADATIPSRTAACVADGGSGHAGTVDHDHTRPATHTGLRDNTVWLRYWRGTDTARYLIHVSMTLPRGCARPRPEDAPAIARACTHNGPDGSAYR